jgi:hypothetical protein
MTDKQILEGLVKKYGKKALLNEMATPKEKISQEQIMRLLKTKNKLYVWPGLVHFEDRGDMWAIYYDDVHIININKAYFDEEYLYEIGWLQDDYEPSDDDFEIIDMADVEDIDESYDDRDDFRTSKKMKHDRQIKSIKRDKKFNKMPKNIRPENILDDEFDDEFEYNYRK